MKWQDKKQQEISAFLIVSLSCLFQQNWSWREIKTRKNENNSRKINKREYNNSRKIKHESSNSKSTPLSRSSSGSSRYIWLIHRITRSLRIHWRWMTITDDEWRWMTITDDEWRWMSMNDDEWRWMPMNEDEWRWMTMNVDKWRWMTMNADEWRWMTMNAWRRVKMAPEVDALDGLRIQYNKLITQPHWLVAFQRKRYYQHKGSI